MPDITQPNQYVVQLGDTLNQIAQKLNTAPNLITGFRSGDPNLIFPGETLSVGAAPMPAAPVTSPTPPTAPAVVPPAIPVASPVPPTPVPATAPVSEPISTVPTSPFGTDIEAILTKYGIKPPSTTESPFTSFVNMYKELFKSLGLTDVKTRIEESTKSIEAIDTQIAQDIAEVNNNPFIAQNIRSSQIARIQQKGEIKRNALVNRLRLDQTLFEQGQQEAQFVASQGMSQFKTGQELTKDIAFKAIDLAEKRAQAEQGLQMTHQQQQLNEQQVFKANELKYEREQNKITTHFETDAKGNVTVIGTKPSGETSIIGTYPGKGKPSKAIKEAKDIFKSSESIIQQYKKNNISREQIEKQYADAGKAIPIEVQTALDKIYPKPATAPSTFHWYNPLTWF